MNVFISQLISFWKKSDMRITNNSVDRRHSCKYQSQVKSIQGERLLQNSTDPPSIYLCMILMSYSKVVDPISS